MQTLNATEQPASLFKRSKLNEEEATCKNSKYQIGLCSFWLSIHVRNHCSALDCKQWSDSE